jgi:hypothetical protein
MDVAVYSADEMVAQVAAAEQLFYKQQGFFEEFHSGFEYVNALWAVVVGASDGRAA